MIRKAPSQGVKINCAYCKHGGEEHPLGFMYPCKFLSHCTVTGWGKCEADRKGGAFELDEEKLKKWNQALKAKDN